ncbi:MAG: NADH-quinone oxidoreductase subunit J [Planctomycetes bacterium]|nr:NADH-quinone oxidoreductase subunit J [Planctomycetota bacterium]
MVLTVGSACVVAFSKNIVRSAFSLLLTFVGVAGLYGFLEADFLVATQLLIYVGGILVLLLFAVMLTHRISNIKASNETSFSALAALAATGIFLVLVEVGTKTHWDVKGGPLGESTRPIGLLLMGDYLLPFEVAAMILLAALIGAAYLARNAIRK